MIPHDLIDLYKNEALAQEAFREYRLRKGVVCKKCGGKHHYWLSSKKQFQCKQCRFRTTLQSGTVLQGSKLPVYYFFIALHMLMEKDMRMSIDEFQRQTGHKYYEPLWDFVHKLKNFVKTNPHHIQKDFEAVVDMHFLSSRQVS